MRGRQLRHTLTELDKAVDDSMALHDEFQRKRRLAGERLAQMDADGALRSLATSAASADYRVLTLIGAQGGGGGASSTTADASPDTTTNLVVSVTVADPTTLAEAWAPPLHSVPRATVAQYLTQRLCSVALTHPNPDVSASAIETAATLTAAELQAPPSDDDDDDEVVDDERRAASGGGMSHPIAAAVASTPLLQEAWQLIAQEATADGIAALAEEGCLKSNNILVADDDVGAAPEGGPHFGPSWLTVAAFTRLTGIVRLSLVVVRGSIPLKAATVVSMGNGVALLLRRAFAHATIFLSRGPARKGGSSGGDEGGPHGDTFVFWDPDLLESLGELMCELWTQFPEATVAIRAGFSAHGATHGEESYRQLLCKNLVSFMASLLPPPTSSLAAAAGSIPSFAQSDSCVAHEWWRSAADAPAVVSYVASSDAGEKDDDLMMLPAADYLERMAHTASNLLQTLDLVCGGADSAELIVGGGWLNDGLTSLVGQVGRICVEGLRRWGAVPDTTTSGALKALRRGLQSPLSIAAAQVRRFSELTAWNGLSAVVGLTENLVPVVATPLMAMLMTTLLDDAGILRFLGTLFSHVDADEAALFILRPHGWQSSRKRARQTASSGPGTRGEVTCRVAEITAALVRLSAVLVGVPELSIFGRRIREKLLPADQHVIALFRSLATLSATLAGREPPRDDPSLLRDVAGVDDDEAGEARHADVAISAEWRRHASIFSACAESLEIAAAGSS